MDLESLSKRKEELQSMLTQLSSQYQMVSGCIAECDNWMKRIEEAEEKAKKEAANEVSNLEEPPL